VGQRAIARIHAPDEKAQLATAPRGHWGGRAPREAGVFLMKGQSNE
jgi:hypothetical protein